MKQLKIAFYFTLLILSIISCKSHPTKNVVKEKPVVIANEDLEYEIIIIDPGFNFFLNSQARTINYHSNTYLRNKNNIYVSIWNSRARNSQRFNSNIYENIIEYDPKIDYGLEVNYKLFWYFKFAEQKYQMKLNF